ncbi:response regulator transcription factor [Salegentibacter sp. F14]
MKNDFRKIAKYWREEYSSNIRKYNTYEAGKNFDQIASFFTPGDSFYYVLNMHNLELEFISQSVEDFVGDPSDQVQMSDLLSLAEPSEIGYLQLKEKVIKDFYLNYLSPDQIMDYKVMYTYKLKDYKDKIRTILHQASALSVSENGFFEHIFSVHSDISHLNSGTCNRISFMHLKGGASYYNIDIRKGKFDPEATLRQEDLKKLFSPREKEIISRIAKGENAQQIAENLHISIHTVKTHRKNILQKSGCKNATELVANCLVGGVISIN